MTGSNIRRAFINGVPDQHRRISDMVPGEHAYTFPWAVRDGSLCTSFTITSDRIGTSCMLVVCVGPELYDIVFNAL